MEKEIYPNPVVIRENVIYYQSSERKDDMEAVDIE